MTGLAKVLSIIVKILLFLAKSLTDFKSIILSLGLLGVSIYITLVFFLISFSKSFEEMPDVKLNSIPNFGNSVFIKFLVPPYKSF